MSSVDAVVNNEIFRKDALALIAMKRQDATLFPGRCVYDATGYVAGQVLGQYTTGPYTNMYGKYDDSGVSGLDTAVGILAEPISADVPSGTNQAKQIIVAGYVYEAKLTSLTSSAKADLKSRSIYNAALGVTVLSF